jgi:phosphate transport system permease protein
MNDRTIIRKIRQRLGLGLLHLFTFTVLLFLGIIIWDIGAKGMPALNGTFLWDYPRRGMTEGGIFPAIVRTTFITLITTLFCIPLGSRRPFT